MRHPVPARLKAFARHHIDSAGEVEKHVGECDECAQIVLHEMLDAPETPGQKAVIDSLIVEPKELLRRVLERAQRRGDKDEPPKP